MDGIRFDVLTRKLVTDRRKLIRGFAASAAALVATKGGGVLAACRPGGYACSRDSDCCSQSCGSASKSSRNRVCCVATQTNEQMCADLACGIHTNDCGQQVSCGSCPNEGGGDPCKDVGACQAGVCIYTPNPNYGACGI